MMGWYPPLNEFSDSTWHMFTHVVEANEHSLHDIMFMVDYILLMLASNVY